jgi:hypothetical protein
MSFSLKMRSEDFKQAPFADFLLELAACCHFGPFSHVKP